MANIRRIVGGSKLNIDNLSGEVYKKPIYFLSYYEEKYLLAIQELFKDSKNYFTSIYVPIKTEDTYRLMFENVHPCFHSTPDCNRINSDYSNYHIPEEISKQGPDWKNRPN